VIFVAESFDLELSGGFVPHHRRLLSKVHTMVRYPKFKACAAHVAPIFLDAEATVQKACSLIAEAASAGAQLIAFPESFVPGFPIWAGVQAPIKNHAFFKRLAANSIEVPGPPPSRRGPKPAISDTALLSAIRADLLGRRNEKERKLSERQGHCHLLHHLATV
jgi:hypothetical protein